MRHQTVHENCIPLYGRFGIRLLSLASILRVFYPLETQNFILIRLLGMQFLLHRKHKFHIKYEDNSVIVFRTKVSVGESCEAHKKTTCGQNDEILNVKAGGVYSYHCGLKGYSLMEQAV